MIELLIVVAVMVILIGIALPVMKTGIEGRKLREAARQVNTGATLAKALAAEKGTYAGLVIDPETLPEDTSKLFARRLFLAETPPPYSGDVLGAVATIDTSTGSLRAGFLDGRSANLANVARVGDFIRFDFRNPFYQMGPPTALGSGTFVVDLTGPTPWPNHGATLPYQIIRKPEKSNATAFELPNGAVIDLNNSGFGLTDLSLARGQPPTWSVSTAYLRGTYCRPTAANGFCYVAVVGGISGTSEPTPWPAKLGASVLDGTAPNIIRWQCVPPVPVTVVLGPSGRMSGVTGLAPPMGDMPTETLHLLIGDLENIGALNLANRSALWVSIGHHTGRITTAENAALPPLWIPSAPYTLGTYCQPTVPNGLCYIATVAGVSGATEPTWPILSGQTVTDGGVIWECRSPTPWAASTGYLRGTYCRPTTPNGFCYVATVAGISGGSQPGWPTTLGATVVDNGVTWECTLLMEPAREFAQSAQAMGGL